MSGNNLVLIRVEFVRLGTVPDKQGNDTPAYIEINDKAGRGHYLPLVALPVDVSDYKPGHWVTIPIPVWLAKQQDIIYNEPTPGDQI